MSDTSPGYDNELAIGVETVAGTPVSPTVRVVANSWGLPDPIERYESPGMEGTPFLATEQVVDAQTRVTWKLETDLIIQQAAFLLSMGMGDISAGNPILSKVMDSFTIVGVDPVKKRTVAGGYCNTMEGRIDEGGDRVLKLIMDGLGLSLTPSAKATTGVVLPAAYTLLPLKSATVSYGGTSVKIKSATWKIDNKLEAQFRNSQTANDIARNDRADITVGVNVDYNSGNYTAIRTAYEAGSALAVVMTFANGGSSLVLTFPKVRNDAGLPDLGGRAPVMWDIAGRCASSALGALDAMSAVVTVA